MDNATRAGQLKSLSTTPDGYFAYAFFKGPGLLKPHLSCVFSLTLIRHSSRIKLEECVAAVCKEERLDRDQVTFYELRTRCGRPDQKWPPGLYSYRRLDFPLRELRITQWEDVECPKEVHFVFKDLIGRPFTLKEEVDHTYARLSPERRAGLLATEECLAAKILKNQKEALRKFKKLFVSSPDEARRRGFLFDPHCRSNTIDPRAELDQEPNCCLVDLKGSHLLLQTGFNIAPKLYRFSIWDTYRFSMWGM